VTPAEDTRLGPFTEDFMPRPASGQGRAISHAPRQLTRRAPVVAETREIEIQSGQSIATLCRAYGTRNERDRKANWPAHPVPQLSDVTVAMASIESLQSRGRSTL
jgi:hypothetical protein